MEAPLKEELYILSILTIGPNGHADAKRKILVKLKILEKFFFFVTKSEPKEAKNINYIFLLFYSLGSISWRENVDIVLD